AARYLRLLNAYTRACRHRSSEIVRMLIAKYRMPPVLPAMARFDRFGSLITCWMNCGATLLSSPIESVHSPLLSIRLLVTVAESGSAVTTMRSGYALRTGSESRFQNLLRTYTSCLSPCLSPTDGSSLYGPLENGRLS